MTGRRLAAAPEQREGDIARAARTYNVQRYFIVTPIERQRTLAARIVEHWCEGPGATRVPERGEALRLVETAETLEDVIAEITRGSGSAPRRRPSG